MKMNFGILGLATICCALAPVISAKVSPDVGEKAPDLGKINWVVNAPETDSIEGLRGEVVVLELWSAEGC